MLNFYLQKVWKSTLSISLIIPRELRLQENQIILKGKKEREGKIERKGLWTRHQSTWVLMLIITGHVTFGNLHSTSLELSFLLLEINGSAQIT